MQNSQEKNETSSGDNSTENTFSKTTTTTNQPHEVTESTDTSLSPISGGGKNAGEVKMCPMPSCKNPVRRGRYCNSCQKRKESLNRTLAMEGIHLPSAKTRRGKKGPETSSQESPEKAVRKQRKKQRNDDGASDDAESINHLMNQDDELRRRSAGVSISSLLSQPAPPNPLQVPPQLTSLHPSATSKMPTPLSGLSSLPTLTSMMGQVAPQMNMSNPRGYVTPPLMSQMAKLEEDRMSTLKRFDTIMVEFAGNDDEASQLLREYIQSAFGRRRLAVPSTM